MPIIAPTEDPLRWRFLRCCCSSMMQRGQRTPFQRTGSQYMAWFRYQAEVHPEQAELLDRLAGLYTTYAGVFVLVPPLKITQFFEFNSQIGEGGYGSVFRAMPKLRGLEAVSWLEEGKPLAVKRLPIPRSGFAEEVTRSVLNVTLERHIEFMNHIAGPQTRANHLLQLMAVFVEHRKALYQVMELLQGPDLFDYLAERPTLLEERAAAGLAKQALCGVHYLHRAVGALHRDVKPENFGFSVPVPPDSDPARSTLKLFDFGLAWVLPEPVTEETAGRLLRLDRCGTALYMSPEVWAKQCGPASDVWATGLVIHLMLSMELPFRLVGSRSVPRSLQENHLAFEGPVWDTLSPASKDFLGALLEKDAHRRASTQQALDHQWLRCPAATAPPGPVPDLQDLKAQSKGKTQHAASVWQNMLMASNHVPVSGLA